MREPQRSPRGSNAILAFASMAVFVMTLLWISSPASAQTPHVLPLDEAGRDSRVDPTLALMMQRAHSRAPLAESSVMALPGDETAGLANFGSALIGPSTPVAVLIEGTVDRALLEGLGVLVGTVAGDVITATLPIGLIPSVLALPGVERISASARVERVLNISVPDMEADSLWVGTPPSYPVGAITGRGVIVGIVDTGVDPRHSDFKDANGNTRFKYVWDQTWSGVPPAGYGYGLEYTASQINANQITYYKDLEGHGTHVAGVAVGNGQGTGNGQGAWRFVGVAPRADIIAVKAIMIESQIIDAVNYVFQRAATLNEAAVVNLSLSVPRGAHDGTYAFDRSLSALTGPGKVITAAAGNRGLENGHYRNDLASGATTDIQFSIPTYTPSPVNAEFLSIEGWHDGTAAFDVKLISPTGIQTAVVVPGGTTGFVQTADGTVYIQNDVVTNQLGAKQIVAIVTYGTDGTARPRSGTWKLNIKRRSGTTSGLSHWWVAEHLFGTTSLPAFLGAGIDTATTVSSPATADSVISTGAYTTKVSWVNFNNTTTKYPGSPPVYRVSDFSSRGPRRDGVQRPDIMAPGYGVMSALSTNAAISVTYQDLDGKHYIAKGTSISNAHTSGAVALLMEQNRYLTPSRARLELRARARADIYTGTAPNGKWGYGKLDMTSPNPTTGVTDRVALGLSFRHVLPNPSRDFSSFEFEVSQIALAQGPSTPVRVRIVDVRGREVAEVRGIATAGIQRVTWDGRSNTGQDAPAGVYFALLEVGKSVVQRKFVRIEP